MGTEYSITEIKKKKSKDTGLMRKFYFKDDNEAMKLLYMKNKTKQTNKNLKVIQFKFEKS